MSKREPDGTKAGEAKEGQATEVETTGHEWDGIKELDNPLPRWWLWTFYACVGVAVVYWLLMPAWPMVGGYTKGLLNHSDRRDVVEQLGALKTQRGEKLGRLRSASLDQIEHDPELQAYAVAVGQSVFGDNCATCHGQGGVGAKGYANLRDDVWLWGGSLDDIHRTIAVGVRSDHPETRISSMPAFGRDGMLTSAQIHDLTEYVVALSHRKADRAAAQRGAATFAQQCVACHGPAGEGVQPIGAPNLTDAEWLYGGDREDIRGQIWNGRGGVMPTWGARFDPETLKALAVYIHVNAGGR
ncbi:MAG: cytochrome-c oxidase, cbb3-type subunit III [Caulobacterales bacterium 32-69-10]|nr:MAG: cytochrome-c oxidase, cbb3-type subunit III [Caulobacterales bacterium 32-69-10]